MSEEEIRVAKESLHQPVLRALEEGGLSARLVEPLTLHGALVLVANRSFNLTRIVDPEDIARQQILDSIRIGQHLDLAGASILDLGSGAGYPGVPLAYLEPSAQVTLVESVRKKAEFLERVRIGLSRGNLSVRCSRAEHLIAESNLDWDIVIARAVGRVVRILELLRSVRHRFGRLVLAKGPRWESEIDEAQPLLRGKLYELVDVSNYEIGTGFEPRVIVSIEGRGSHPVRRSSRPKRHRGS